MKQPLPMCTEALRTNLQALRDYQPPLSGRQSSHLRIKTRPSKESKYRVGQVRPDPIQDAHPLHQNGTHGPTPKIPKRPPNIIEPMHPCVWDSVNAKTEHAHQ